MPYIKRMVCLANSLKNGGTCVAGKEITSDGYGNWLRPVSARADAAVRVSEACYPDDRSPKPLDLIEVPLLGANPDRHQTENHLIDPSRRWKKAGQVSWDELPRLQDFPATLWINRASTRTGRLNCLTPEEAATQSWSLALIRPENFTLITSNNLFRASFRYNLESYLFPVTDPLVRGAFLSREEGEYPMSDVFICVSLTEPYAADNRCHKLVASIFTRETL